MIFLPLHQENVKKLTTALSATSKETIQKGQENGSGKIMDMSVTELQEPAKKNVFQTLEKSLIVNHT